MNAYKPAPMNIINSSRNVRDFGSIMEPFRLVSDLLAIQPPGSEVVWSALTPPVHVEYNDEGVSLTLDIPGVDASDVDLTFEGTTLEITGKRGDRTYRYAAKLDDSIDPNTFAAKLDKGVLTVVAERRPETKPRKILVNASSPKSLGETK